MTKLEQYARWLDGLRPADRVRAGGGYGVVTHVGTDFCWVRLDGRQEDEPFEWEQIEPPEVSDE